MRIDYSVPADQRTGVSVYYDDYKKRLAIDYSKIKPNSAFRRNKPHPSKNFLEPRKEPHEGVVLENKVRNAVQSYLNEVYHQTRPNQSNPAYLPQPAFRPKLELDTTTKFEPQYRAFNHPPSNILPSNSHYEDFLGVTGHHIDRPSSAVAAERFVNKSFEGESKRERSVRIKETIKETNRLRTPKPNREAWQKVRSDTILSHKKPHFIGNSFENKTTKRQRISSAPPGVQGYTYYLQSKPHSHEMKHSQDLNSKLEAWSQDASNYEKEVVYNMLKEITPKYDATPNTPMSEDFRKVIDGPAADYHRPGAEQYKSGVIPHKNLVYCKKSRKTHSAPIKRMGGLVPTASQRPLHDHRIYRLKEQDLRLNPSPGEERDLNRYMDELEVNMMAPSKESRRKVAVPMHTHLPRKMAGAQDYHCKVSFFQPVRAPFRKHFTIHPDFTSEELKKRKPVSHTVTHFRY